MKQEYMESAERVMTFIKKSKPKSARAFRPPLRNAKAPNLSEPNTKKHRPQNNRRTV